MNINQIEKTNRYQELSNNLKIAQDYFNKVKKQDEMEQLYIWNEYDNRYDMVKYTSPEDKIKFIQKYSNNPTAMAFLNMINAQDLLSEYVCTAHNTKIDILTL